MEKRKVYIEITQDELALLDIIKQSTDVKLFRHDCTKEEAKMFVELYGKATHKIVNGVEWYETGKQDYETGDSVEVIGFVKDEEEEEKK